MIETRRRSLAKALTWQSTGLVLMTAITWWMTGSVATGGMIAVLGAATGMVTYILHERLWARTSWGMAPERLAGPRRHAGVSSSSSPGR